MSDWILPDGAPYTGRTITSGGITYTTKGGGLEGDRLELRKAPTTPNRVTRRTTQPGRQPSRRRRPTRETTIRRAPLNQMTSRQTSNLRRLTSRRTSAPRPGGTRRFDNIGGSLTTPAITSRQNRQLPYQRNKCMFTCTNHNMIFNPETGYFDLPGTGNNPGVGPMTDAFIVDGCSGVGENQLWPGAGTTQQTQNPCTDLELLQGNCVAETNLCSEIAAVYCANLDYTHYNQPDNEFTPSDQWPIYASHWHCQGGFGGNPTSPT